MLGSPEEDAAVAAAALGVIDAGGVVACVAKDAHGDRSALLNPPIAQGGRPIHAREADAAAKVDAAAAAVCAVEERAAAAAATRCAAGCQRTDHMRARERETAVKGGRRGEGRARSGVRGGVRAACEAFGCWPLLCMRGGSYSGQKHRNQYIP